MDYIKEALKAIEARANVFKVMAYVDTAMRENGADDNAVLEYLDACSPAVTKMP